MKCFGNASQDDIQKLMAKSKNKNTTKLTATWRNVYHTWVKHRGEVLEIKKLGPKNLTKFYNFLRN